MLLLPARLSETSVLHQKSMTGGQNPGPGLLTPSLSPRYDEGSGGSGDEGRDEAHKREWNLFYQKQMSLRKVKGMGACWGHRWPPVHMPSAPTLELDGGAVLQLSEMPHRPFMSSSRAKTPR